MATAVAAARRNRHAGARGPSSGLGARSRYRRINRERSVTKDETPESLHEYQRLMLQQQFRPLLDRGDDADLRGLLEMVADELAGPSR